MTAILSWEIIIFAWFFACEFCAKTFWLMIFKRLESSVLCSNFENLENRRIWIKTMGNFHSFCSKMFTIRYWVIVWILINILYYYLMHSIEFISSMASQVIWSYTNQSNFQWFYNKIGRSLLATSSDLSLESSKTISIRADPSNRCQPLV